MEHTQTGTEREMPEPSLNSTRRYQVDPAINIMVSVKEVIHDAIEKHQDEVRHVFVNSKYMDSPETFGDNEVLVHPASEVPVNQIWIQVSLDDCDLPATILSSLV